MLAAEAIFSQDKAKNTRFGYVNERFSTQHGVAKTLSFRVVSKTARTALQNCPYLYGGVLRIAV